MSIILNVQQQNQKKKTNSIADRIKSKRINRKKNKNQVKHQQNQWFYSSECCLCVWYLCFQYINIWSGVFFCCEQPTRITKANGIFFRWKKYGSVHFICLPSDYACDIHQHTKITPKKIQYDNFGRKKINN